MRPYTIPAKLQPLTQAQLDQLHEWLDDVTYEKVAGNLQVEFGIDMSKAALCRYNQIRDLARHLTEKEEDATAVRDFLAIMNGQPVPYGEAGIELVMKRAFDLANAREITPAKLARLLRVFHYNQNREWTNKRIEISDRLAKVREEELALKKLGSARASRAVLGVSPSTPSSDTNHLPLTTNHSSFRLWTAEDLIQNQPKVEAAFRAHPFLSQIGLPPDETPPSNPNLPSPRATSPTSVGTTSTSSQISNPALDNSAAPNEPTAANPSIQESTRPSPPVEPQSENPHSALASPARTRIPQSLEARVTEYTLSRIEEADYGKGLSKVGRYAARNFTSKLLWCPCGQDLPCPQHGEFPNHFWELHPNRADYWDILRLKGLPTTPPHIVQKQREDNERHARFLEWKKNHRATLEAQSKTYAITKWRAFTPRPPQTPASSDQWRDYCPCGAQLPCQHHPDLHRQLLYMKPWDNDYIAALEHNEIPVYTPTQSEIQFWVEQNPDLNPNPNPGGAGSPSLPSDPSPATLPECQMKNVHYADLSRQSPWASAEAPRRRAQYSMLNET